MGNMIWTRENLCNDVAESFARFILKGRSVMCPQNANATVRFSTDGLPEAMRNKAIRDLSERIASPGRIEPLEPLPNRQVRVDITKWSLPGLGIMSGALNGVRQVVRSKVDASIDEDDLLLGVNVSGESIMQYRNREITLQSGDAFVATRGSAGLGIVRATPMRFMGFRVPRAAIEPLVGQLVDDPVRIVSQGQGALSLLVTYADVVADIEYLRTIDLHRLIVTHIQDLIGATIGATHDGLAIARGRGIRAARLRQVINDIMANLDDCDLSVSAVAKRQRMTPRNVHKLLEGRGVSFSTFVIGRRLSRAHRMLSDPRFANCGISTIAFNVGFGDLSYFNRAFRRCYGATPSDVRRAAQSNTLQR